VLRYLPLSLLGALILACFSAFSQDLSTVRAGVTPPATKDSFCDWLPNEIPHADALLGVCQYAATLRQKMPNFVCYQETSRYQGNEGVAADLITATVRYVDGEESYSDVKLNGKVVGNTLRYTEGLWSSGQFGGALRAIFHAANHAEFHFAGEKRDGRREAWVYMFSIARQYEPVWQLRAGNEIAAPAYGGELWVDKQDGHILRVQYAAKDLQRSFPMRSAEIRTDYAEVPFGDGTAFVLPVVSSTTTQFQRYDPTRNTIRFLGCHKFRATSHIVLDAASGSEEKSGGGAESEEARKREIEENEAIYVILRQQAIREDAERTASEQRQQLNFATVNAFWRLATLEKQAQKDAKRPATADDEPPPNPAGEAVATFRIDARLVPVSVVLRDANGNAVGNLTKNDFQLFDERKPQVITTFTVERAAERGRPVRQEAATTPAATNSAQSAPNDESNVAYVFDDLHTPMDDMQSVKSAAEGQVSAMRPGDRAAIYTTSGQVAVDFTQDRDQLQAALKKLRSEGRPNAGDCPPMTYYEASQILSDADRSALEMAVRDALDCIFQGARSRDQPVRPAEAEKAREAALAKAFEMVTAGNVESNRALEMLTGVISRTAALRGRRTMVLVSPGFLTVAPGSRGKATALIELALQSGIVVNTLDASGLTTGVQANRTHFNSPTETHALASQEIAARSEIMADLAFGTGGAFFHNNNDLREEFRRSTEVPEYIYVLGFSPQKLDGKFHKLKVKVSSEKVTVQARPGYYALKQASGS